MGHLFKIILILFVLSFFYQPSYSALNGGVDYRIPIDYDKLSQIELEEQAELYYEAAIEDKAIGHNMTSALNLYTILFNKNSKNPNYSLRLGKLYDVLRKDRYAKGYYFHAINTNPTSPEPYLYLGEYYYEREQFRKALKFYQKAYNLKSKDDEQIMQKIEEIRNILGCTDSNRR